MCSENIGFLLYSHSENWHDEQFTLGIRWIMTFWLYNGEVSAQFEIDEIYAFDLFLLLFFRNFYIECDRAKMWVWPRINGPENVRT